MVGALMAAVAPFAMLAMAGIGAFGQLQAARRQEDAAEESRRLAARNAEYIEAESREHERRLRYQAEREQAEARARIGASGVTMAGSPGLYLEEMQRVMGEELDWLKRSSDYRAEQAITQGDVAYRTGLERAEQSRIGAFETGVSGVGRFGSAQGWWQF